MIVIFYSKNKSVNNTIMKDKTQKSFRGIVRILLLVFCYTFGSHAFALALEHEQTVDIYKVTECPQSA